jgi:hypothetical protein
VIACSRTGSIFALEKKKNFEKFDVVMSWMLSLRLEAFWSWEVEIFFLTVFFPVLWIRIRIWTIIIWPPGYGSGIINTELRFTDPVPAPDPFNLSKI